MIVNIQLLRFIAALLVAAYHISAYYKVAGGQWMFIPFSYFGFAGVDIFFVISGFIMWYTTRGAHGPRASGLFLSRRFGRIYLGYWPFFFLVLFILSYFSADRLKEIYLLESFVLWPQKISENLITISWTLSFELYFYIFFSGLLLVKSKDAIVVLLMTAALILGFNIYAHFANNLFDPSVYANTSVYYRFFLSPYCLEFISGCLLCEYLRVKPARFTWVSLSVGMAFFCIGAVYNSYVLEGNLAAGYHNPQRILFFGLGSLLLMYGFVGLEQKKIYGASKFGVLLGNASYSLYLGHYVFLVIFPFLNYRFDSRFLNEFFFLFLLVSMVFYSVCHYKLIEAPLYRQFKRFLYRISAARNNLKIKFID